MFVGIVGHCLSCLTKNLKHFLTKLIPRIWNQSLFIPRVVALLSDVDHAVNGKLIRPKGQGLCNTVTDFYSVALRTLRNKVSLASLLHINRYNVERSLAKLTAIAIPLKDTVDDVLCVQMRLVNICQDRHSRPLGPRCSFSHDQFLSILAEHLEDQPAHELKDSHVGGR